MEQSLLVFISVVEHQNFTRAAEALHMTQPAVSHYIQVLENSMGVKLLERTNKFVKLNKAGEIVYYHAKEILSLHNRMGKLIADLTNIASGSLSIGASYTFGEYILPHLIASLTIKFPLIHPRIIIGNSKEIIDLILNRELDVGIIEGESYPIQMKATHFATDKMVIAMAANHPLMAKDNLNTKDLMHECWIVREEGSGTREMQEKAFEMMGFTPENKMIFGSTQVIKESVEAGLGVTILSRWALRKELKLGTLKLLHLNGFPLIRYFSLLTPDIKFQTKATEVFIDFLFSQQEFLELK